jgi:hypothetical protein
VCGQVTSDTNRLHLILAWGSRETLKALGAMHRTRVYDDVNYVMYSSTVLVAGGESETALNTVTNRHCIPEYAQRLTRLRLLLETSRLKSQT